MGDIIGSMYYAPNWFFGYDIVLELLFVIIILAVSYYAQKMYKLSGQRQAKLFSLAFLFIAASYFINSILSFSIISTLNQTISDAFRLIGVDAFNITGFFLQSFFFILGLITLTYMTFRIKNKKIYSLMAILVFFALMLSANMAYMFHLLSSIFLIYIVIHYSKNFMKNKKTSTLLVLIAFIFLLFGSIHFIFSVNQSVFYVIGHFLEFVAYTLILINLVLIIKK